MIIEETFVDFGCPHCGDPISFPMTTVGQAQACPTCEKDVIVPKPGTATGLKLPLPLSTPTLLLRRLEGRDWKTLLEVLSDEQAFTYTEGRPLTEEEVSGMLEADQMVRLTTPGQTFFLGIISQDSSKLIGFVTLNFTDAQRLQATLSATVNSKERRKGLASEALTGALEFCFKWIGLHRITVACDSRNIAAWRLCESVGLRREGEFVKDRIINGEWANTICYAMLREEHGRPEAGA